MSDLNVAATHPMLELDLEAHPLTRGMFLICDPARPMHTGLPVTENELRTILQAQSVDDLKKILAELSHSNFDSQKVPA